MDKWKIVEWLFAGLIGYLIGKSVEMLDRYIRHPQITISPHHPNPAQKTFIHHVPTTITATGIQNQALDGGPVQEVRQPFWIVQIEVINEKKAFGVFSRRRAPKLYGIVEFLDENGNWSAWESMPLRWDEPIEPVMPSTQGPLFDRGRVQLTKDIRPGATEIGDIAFAVNGDPYCYGWCNESYRPGLCFNEDWRLPPGRYLVRIKIQSAEDERMKWQSDFLLSNAGGPEQLRLARLE